MANWIIQDSSHSAPAGDSSRVPFAVRKILERRGINEAELEDFLSRTPVQTYDPFLFKGVSEAAETILKALDTGRDIVIYGDYDADGVTATSLLYGVFRNFSLKVFFYIPSRFADGYGLNCSALDKIAAKHPGCLIVTVDCGSTSGAEVEYAKTLGLEVIVSDHHNFEDGKTPDCLILNPKLPENEYPFKDLSGCGVAFKLAQGIERICAAKDDSRFTKTQLNAQLDLVAISTIADVVPLLGENRTLVKYGLHVINERRRRGLAALLDVLDIEGRVSSDEVAYILAPNINALGRMDTAEHGVELLEGSSRSMSELYALATHMAENNKRRRREQDKTTAICAEQLETEDCGEYFLVIRAPGAHEGVAGIVAGNLKEKYYRPVFICTPGDNALLKGTGRCIAGINLHELMAKHSELFIRFGGHSGACGFSMRDKDLPLLRSAMQEEIKLLLEACPDILSENLIIEKELSYAEKSIAFAEALEQLEPFGEANPRPCFCILGASVQGLAFMGQERQHARFSVKSDDGVSVACIVFKHAPKYGELLGSGHSVDVAGELSINEYNGRKKLQMIVKDIRRSLF